MRKLCLLLSVLAVVLGLHSTLSLVGGLHTLWTVSQIDDPYTLSFAPSYLHYFQAAASSVFFMSTGVFLFFYRKHLGASPAETFT